MHTLKETVNFIKANYPQTLVVQKDFDVDDRQHIAVERPQFLFRGENAIWEETRSTFGRKQISREVIFPEINHWVTGRYLHSGEQSNHFSLYYFLREALWDVSCVTEESTSSRIAESVAGLLQHYGFDTSFIDLTSDIMVAAFFGSLGATPDGIGQIMILPTRNLETRVFDLSQETANRPKRQRAFALLAPENFNLKEKDFQEEFGATWLRYRVSQDNKEKYNFPELLSIENDMVAGHIVEWYEAHIRCNTSVSDEVKFYFQKKIDLLLK